MLLPALLYAGFCQAAWAQLPSYTLAEIGSEIAAENPGNTYSTALKVNAHGDAVGWALVAGDTRAFFYNPVTGVVMLPLIAGRAGNKALGLNDRNAAGEVLIAGSSLASSFDDPGMAVLWRVDAQSGNVVEMRDIGALPGFTAGVLTAVNNRGLAVGYSTGLSTGQQVMSYDAANDLLAPIDFPAAPTDVNNQDQLVGRNFRGDVNGALEDLGVPDNHGLADLAAMNDRGWAAGYSTSSSTDGAGRRIKDIVRYRADWEVLGGLSSFDGGDDINNRGDVVGRYGGEFAAAVYLEAEGQLFPLENLLADTADTVSEANGINDAGVIAGVGTGGAVLLVPDIDPPPPPPAAPSNLTASESSADTAIDIAWMDNSDDEDGFAIERALAGSVNWMELGVVSATAYTDQAVSAGTAYDYRVRARNSGGNSPYSNVATASAPASTPVDNEAPVMTLLRPADREQVSGTVAVSGSATDNVGVVLVSVAYNGSGGNGTICSAAASTVDCSWDVGSLIPGSYTVTATAYDAAGNSGMAVAGITVADVQAPSVSLLSPVSGTAVSGEVPVSAIAADNAAVTSLTIRYSSAAGNDTICASATADTLDCNWNTAGLASGGYVVTATARDGAGNDATSQAMVEVVSLPPSGAVDDQAPLVTVLKPGAGTQHAAMVLLSVGATDNVGVTMLRADYDSVHGNGNICVVAGSGILDCSWDVSTLVPGSYRLAITAIDAAGNTTSNTLEIAVLDVQHPLVELHSPVDGARIAGHVAVSSSASDDAGVVELTLTYSGVNSGVICSVRDADVLNCEWPVDGLAPGAYRVIASARDGAGNLYYVAIDVEKTGDEAQPVTSVDPDDAPGKSVASSLSWWLLALVATLVGIRRRPARTCRPHPG